MSIYVTRQYDGIYTQNPTLAQQREAALIAQNPTAAQLAQDRRNLEMQFDVAEGTKATTLAKQIRAVNEQIHQIPLDLNAAGLPPALVQAETAYQTAINSPTRYNMDKFQALDAEMGSFYETGQLSPTAISTLQSLVPQNGDPMGGAAQVVKDWQSFNDLTGGGGKAVFPAVSQLYNSVKQATGGVGDPSVDGFVSNMDSLLLKESAPSGLNQLMGSIFAPAITGALAGGLLSGMGVTGIPNQIASSLVSSGGDPLKALTSFGLSSLGDLTGLSPSSLFGGTPTDAATQAAMEAGTAASGTPTLADWGYQPSLSGAGTGLPSDISLSSLSSGYTPLTDQITTAALGGGGLAAAALSGMPDVQSALSSLSTPDTSGLTLTPSGSMPILNPYTGAAGGASLLGAAGLSGLGGSGVTPDFTTSSNSGLLGDIGNFVTSNPNLVSTGLGLAGSYLAGQSATDAARQSADAQIRAAQIAADAAKFKPVGVSTRFGQSQFGYDANGNLISAGYTPSADIKAQQDALMAASGGMLNQFTGSQAATAPMGVAAQRAMELGQGYLGTTPQEQAAKYMAEQQALLAPYRERELAALQAQNQARGRTGFSMGGTSTLGASNPEMEAYFNAKRMQDLNLAAQATQGGMDYSKFGTGMVGAGGDLLKGMFGTQAAAYSPYQTALGGATTLEGLAQQPMDIGINIGAKGTAAAGQAGLLTAQGIQGAAQTMQPANAYSPWGALLSGASQGLKQYTQPNQYQQGMLSYDPTQYRLAPLGSA